MLKIFKNRRFLFLFAGMLFCLLVYGYCEIKLILNLNCDSSFLFPGGNWKLKTVFRISPEEHFASAVPLFSLYDENNQKKLDFRFGGKGTLYFWKGNATKGGVFFAQTESQTGDYELELSSMSGKLHGVWREKSTVRRFPDIVFLDEEISSLGKGIISSQISKLNAKIVLLRGTYLQELIKWSLSGAILFGVFICMTFAGLWSRYRHPGCPEPKRNELFRAVTITFLLELVLLTVCGGVWEDTPLALESATLKDFLCNPLDINPEKTEKRLFVLALLSAPLILAFFGYRVAGKQSPVINFDWEKAAGIGIFCLFIAVGIKESLSFFIIVSATVCALATCALSLQKKGIACLPFLGGVVLLISIWKTVVEIVFPVLSFFYVHHYSSVVHSIWLNDCGFVPSCDFSTQYGLYSLFLQPFFTCFGLSLASLNVVFAILAFMVLGLLFFSISKFCKRIFFAMLGISAIAFVSGMGDWWFVYLQYFPLRMIFPALFLFLYSLNLKKESILLKIGISFIAGLGILWNPESGLIVFICWILLLIAEAGAGWHFTWKSLLKVPFHFCVGICAIGVFEGIVKVVYGSAPDLARIFRYGMLFGEIGFMSMPMPVFGWWWIIAGIYLGGLGYSIFCWSRKQFARFPRFILALSLLGCGLFSYYLGRSVQGNLWGCSYPALLLASLFADKMLLQWKKTRVLLGVLSLLLLFYPVVQAVPKVFQKHAKEALTQSSDILKAGVGLTKIVDGSPQRNFLPYLQFGTFYAIFARARAPIPFTGFEESILKSDSSQLFRNLAAYQGTPAVVLLEVTKYRGLPAYEHLEKQIYFSLGKDCRKERRIVFNIPLPLATPAK